MKNVRHSSNFCQIGAGGNEDEIDNDDDDDDDDNIYWVLSYYMSGTESRNLYRSLI